MKYLSIIVLILLCGCKEKKTVETNTAASKLESLTTVARIVQNSDTLEIEYFDGKEWRKEPRIKSGWLQGKEYDRPKKRKKKAIKWCFDNNGMEWNPSWNLNYRDTTNGGKYYDSSYTITWDSSGHQFGGGIQAVPKGYKSKDKDVYGYSVKVPFGNSFVKTSDMDSGGFSSIEMYGSYNPAGTIGERLRLDSNGIFISWDRGDTNSPDFHRMINNKDSVSVIGYNRKALVIDTLKYTRFNTGTTHIK